MIAQALRVMLLVGLVTFSAAAPAAIGRENSALLHHLPMPCGPGADC